MYENLTYAELKRMLKNDDLWHFIEIVMNWPFDESSLNYFLLDVKKETPEYILILDAFFQTGRDIIIHWNNLPKGGQLEQLKNNLQGNTDDGHLIEYLISKIDLSKYLGEAYRQFFYLKG